MPLVYQAFNWSERRLRRRHHGQRDDRRGRRHDRAKCAATRWRCCRSAATTWAITSATGSQHAAESDRDAARVPRELVPQRTPTASSSGPASSRQHARAQMDRRSRARGRLAPKETPIGWVPRYRDIDWTGLNFPKEKFEELQALRPRGLAHRRSSSHEELFIDLNSPSAEGADLRAGAADLPDVAGGELARSGMKIHFMPFALCRFRPECPSPPLPRPRNSPVRTS